MVDLCASMLQQERIACCYQITEDLLEAKQIVSVLVNLWLLR